MGDTVTVEIVPMQPRHLDALAKLEADNFSQPWSRQGLEAELPNPLALFLVAQARGEAVGYVGCHQAMDQGDIANVVVDARFRRQGVAQALLKSLAEAAQEKGMIQLTLEVRASNLGAIALYEKMGFQCQGIRKGFYSYPREDALVMTWFLPEKGKEYERCCY